MAENDKKLTAQIAENDKKLTAEINAQGKNITELTGEVKAINALYRRFR